MWWVQWNARILFVTSKQHSYLFSYCLRCTECCQWWTIFGPISIKIDFCFVFKKKKPKIGEEKELVEILLSFQTFNINSKLLSVSIGLFYGYHLCCFLAFLFFFGFKMKLSSQHVCMIYECVHYIESRNQLDFKFSIWNMNMHFFFILFWVFFLVHTHTHTLIHQAITHQIV